MNFEEILLPSVVYNLLVLCVIAANLLWAVYRTKFLRLLQEYEPELWLELGSPKGYFIFSSTKDIKIENYISKKKWVDLKSENLKRAAQKAVYSHTVFILMVALLISSFLGPLLAHQIP